MTSTAFICHRKPAGSQVQQRRHVQRLSTADAASVAGIGDITDLRRPVKQLMDQVVCDDVMIESQANEVPVKIGRIDFNELRVGLPGCTFSLLVSARVESGNVVGVLEWIKDEVTDGNAPKVGPDRSQIVQ